MNTPSPAPPGGCPPAAELAAFHRGNLPPAAADAVTAHVEGCPACEAALRGLDDRESSLVSDLRGADLPTVPGRYAGPPALEGAGTLVGGRYLLVEPLGEGGMGTVWLARQTEPIRREVAVKLIKPGMDTAAVLRRFDAERQALAVMDHPNIARVFDAGATDRGRPYFVMERVAGVPITRYCDDRQLTPRERLALFVPVCRAVQHAHQKGIIHRDLKPTNVLVAETDGRPVPKVIDFGVAKATGQSPADQPAATGLGMVVGTPEYMAPEQADPGRADIDTRADVYALGVLLYELLTGTTPLTRQRAGHAAILEVLRLVREEEPPPPSSRLSTADALPSIAANRSTEPARLSRLMRGDLDWVVMKALEKDRGRRYESAGGFARDVERYLADEPVEAGKPTRGYRLRKFARRHRRPLVAAAALTLTLLAAASVSTWQAVRATRAEADAIGERDQKADALRQLAAEQGQTQAALAQARDELDTREAVQRFFLEKVFAAGRPTGRPGGLGKDVTLRRAVDAAAPDIAAAFAGRPLVEAAVRANLGATYAYFDEHALAVPQFEAAHRLAAAARGAAHPEVHTLAIRLARSLERLDRTDEALRVLQPVLDGLTAADHPDRFAAAETLGMIDLRLGRAPDAVVLLEPLAPQAAARFGPDGPAALNIAFALGRAYQQVDRLDEAVALFERVAAVRRQTLPPGDADTLLVEGILSLAYLHAGRMEDAVRLLTERVIPGRTAQVGADALSTLTSVRYLAEAYMALGRPADAIPLLERVVAGRVKQLPPDHPDTLTARQVLVLAHLESGRTAAALPLLDDYLRRLHGKLPAGHPRLGVELLRVGTALLQVGQFARAEPLLRESLAIKEATEPNTVPTLDNRSLLGAALAGQGKYAEAEPLLLSGYEELKRRAPELPPHLAPVVVEAADRLAQLYAAWHKPAEAAKWRAERATYPPEEAPAPRRAK